MISLPFLFTLKCFLHIFFDSQLHHPSEKSGGLKSFEEHDDDDQPFPTLERALCVIDRHAGKSNLILIFFEAYR